MEYSEENMYCPPAEPFQCAIHHKKGTFMSSVSEVLKSYNFIDSLHHAFVSSLTAFAEAVFHDPLCNHQ